MKIYRGNELSGREFAKKFPQIAKRLEGGFYKCDCEHCEALVAIFRKIDVDPERPAVPEALAFMVETASPPTTIRVLDNTPVFWEIYRDLVREDLDPAVRRELERCHGKILDEKSAEARAQILEVVRSDPKKFVRSLMDIAQGKIPAPENQPGGSPGEPPLAATGSVDAADARTGEEEQTMNTVTMKVDTSEDRKDAKSPVSGKWKEMGIARECTQIVLPEGMTHNEAIEWIKRKRDEEERVVAVYEEIVGYPLDAAIAFVKALQEVKGFISLTATPSFFGERPPTMVTVETGVNETTQVPWGRMLIPGIEGFVATAVNKKDNLPILVIRGEVKMRFRDEVAQICRVAREILRRDSIYKGKAIRVQFPDEDDEENFDPSLAPKFVDVSSVDEGQLIFPEGVMRQVKTSIFTPVEHTEKCRAAKIPLKRGVLLEGPYGTGKTLTAYVTAKKCVENGWTFIYLESVADLDQAILFARAYEPACIFAEDIDRTVEGERTVEMDAVLNTIDGIDTKSSELMVILTTNHVEDINQAMLRPGRLDAVIPVRAPDAKAAERLVRQYGATMLEEGVDLSRVGERLAGQIPAVIREVVERSKLSAVAHQAEAGGRLVVSADDLVTAAEGMVTHLELLNRKEEQMTPGVAMARAFAEKLAERFNDQKWMDGLEREAKKLTAAADGAHAPT